MKVAVLGSGMVGQALGLGFVREGHEVKMGTRSAGDPKIKTWLDKAGPKASAGDFAAAAAFGELAVLCTLWSGTENAIQLARPENLKGKIVIDVTNPLTFDPGQPPRLAVGFTDSGGERIQRWLPDSKVVKAFNIITAGHMIKPAFREGPPTMFIAGNDPAAKAKVIEILKTFGWPDSIDMGDIEKSRLLEPLAMIWIDHYVRTQTLQHAFRLLRN